MGAVVHAEDAVLDGRTHGDGLAAEGLADAPRAVLEADEAVLVDLADAVAGPVLDGRQGFGEGAWARVVAVGRHRQGERIVRPVVVVEMAPGVEGTLAVDEIAEAVGLQQLGLEGAMEALVLALGLRMVRPPMTDPHTQAQQPGGEGRVRLIAGIAPGRAVVHQHRQRQAVAPEHSHQAPPHGGLLLVAAGGQPDRIARMIVEYGERMAAPRRQRKVALEIHLPELVRGRPFEALIRTRMFVRPYAELAVPAQDRRD